MPINARIGVNDEGFNMLTKKFLLSIPARLKIHAVTVVPIFAPMMTLIDCLSVMSPEFTKPTTITVVADELWITAVTARPVNSPANLFVVNRPRSNFSPFPARLSRAWPISVMPNRNRHRPPIKFNPSKKSIKFSPFLFRLQEQSSGLTSNALSGSCKIRVKQRAKNRGRSPCKSCIII